MTLPPWMAKLVVGALITGIIGGAFAWASGTTSKVAKHDTDIAVQSSEMSDVKEDISEIKQDQKEILRILRTR